ncbi:MAG: bifunctional 5,10-methylenetetrahydrofolate dehydrogenase/5,10-methenyltetrahydrofolate cyclohydrolase [Chloroflexota bacterium]
MSTRGVSEASGAALIDGKALAGEILADASGHMEELRRRHGFVPGVRVVMVGEEPASDIYARRILRTAQRVGASGELIRLAPDAGLETVRRTLRELSKDASVGGVILQLPLPAGLQPGGLIEELDPIKDLDGIHPLNAGLISRGLVGFAPSCAEAALQILRRTGVPLAGKRAVVVGRSNVVGRPAQLLLMGEDATVTVCHRQTRDLDDVIRQAEIVVVAAGSPGLVTGDAICPGAVVIDCGINVLSDGSICGDVDLPSVAPVAAAVTPVPGGVGPVTNAVLMQHLARASRAQLDGSPLGAPEMAS